MLPTTSNYYICCMWTQLISSECISYYVSDHSYVEMCGTFVNRIMIILLLSVRILNGQLMILRHKRKYTCILWFHSRPPLNELSCFLAPAPIAKKPPK